jgi:hypothetical protein
MFSDGHPFKDIQIPPEIRRKFDASAMKPAEAIIWQSLTVVVDDKDCAGFTEITEDPMRESSAHKVRWQCMLLLAAAAVVPATGCQVDIGGQTLPSGYYLNDDVQYFPPGPEFKLSKEAAAMKTYKEEQAAQQRAVSAGLTPMRR